MPKTLCQTLHECTSTTTHWALHAFRITCTKSALSLLKSWEWHYISDQQQLPVISPIFQWLWPYFLCQPVRWQTNKYFYIRWQTNRILCLYVSWNFVRLLQMLTLSTGTYMLDIICFDFHIYSRETIQFFMTKTMGFSVL